MIFSSVKSTNLEVIFKLYLAQVRPHLDYAEQFWFPYHRKGIGLVESVQRGMAKRIQRMRGIPYEMRMKLFNLYFLEMSVKRALERHL